MPIRRRRGSSRCRSTSTSLTRANCRGSLRRVLMSNAAAPVVRIELVSVERGPRSDGNVASAPQHAVMGVPATPRWWICGIEPVFPTTRSWSAKNHGWFLADPTRIAYFVCAEDQFSFRSRRMTVLHGMLDAD